MTRLRGFLLAWIAALVAVWIFRPLLPPDELRYLSVAWEMHAKHAWLVPTLNGEPYSHKPPLLFWLFRGGWEVLGPVAWWPRLVQAAAGALSLLLTARLARQLDPTRRGSGAAAALILGGTVAFQAYSGFLLFDLWLTVFVLLGWTGLVRACRDDRSGAPAAWRGWLLFALAGGAALLTKGPAALLSLLPLALLRRAWWGPVRRPRLYWTALPLAILAASAIALAWAVPAAAAGGEEYGRAILYGQTTSRLGDAAAHARPFWWSLLLLPALAAPWILWPRLWRGNSGASAALTRFGLAAFLPALLIFSLVSGKQPHYLLPVFPALALWAAGRLSQPDGGLPRAFGRIALAAPILALLANLAFCFTLGPRYDLADAAAKVQAAQSAGRPVALFGMAYHGEFHWLRRLTTPIADPEHAADMRAWLQDHPDGLVLLVLADEGADPRLRAAPAELLPLGSKDAAFWNASALAPLLFPTSAAAPDAPR